MYPSRRKILETFGAVALMGVMGPFGALAESRVRRLVFTRADATMCAVDLHTFERQITPLGFRGHGYVHNARYSSRLWTVQKWGPNAAEVDTAGAKVLRRIECPSGMQFYGHGLYWEGKNLLLIGCVDNVTGQSRLAGYDHDSLKQVAMFDVAAGGLHECRFVSGDTVLVVSTGLKNSADYQPQAAPRLEPSSVIEFDLSSGRVVGKKEIGDDGIFLTHCVRFNDGTIVAISNHRPEAKEKHGNVYFAAPQMGGMQRVELEAELDGLLQDELLSMAIDENRKIVATTNPNSGTVLFVDARNGKLISHVRQEASGVVFDNTLGFLSSGAELVKVDPFSHAVARLFTKDGKDASGAVGAVTHSFIV